MAKGKWDPASLGCSVIALLLIVAAGVIFVVNYNEQHESDNPSQSESFDVTPKGGDFSFKNGIAVKVPAGAVDAPSTLRVSDPASLRVADGQLFGNLRSGGVEFDVSLVRSGNEIQPDKPLEVKIPLLGKFVPSSVDTSKQRPWLYMPWKSNLVDHLLVPTKVDGATLVASMNHLSPKRLVYVSDKELLESYFASKAATSKEACKQKLEVDKSTVRIKATNWSPDDDNAAIRACLIKGKDGYVRVGISNAIDYMLSVAATPNVRLATSTSSANEEVIKSITDTVFLNDKAKALLGYDSAMVGSVATNKLPATIELMADPRTFFAESAWNLTNLVVGVIGGKSGSATEQVAKLPQAVDVVSCLQEVAKTAKDEPSMLVIGGAIVSDCLLTIVGEVATQVGASALWKISVIGEAISAMYDTGRTAINGIRLTLNNTMRVEVEREFDLSPFVGEWHNSGAYFKINEDGTGESQWRAGPCPEDSRKLCHGNAKIVAVPSASGVTVSYGTEWYTNYTTGKPEAGNDSVDRRSTYILRSDSLLELERGDYFFCRLGSASDDELRKCNLL